MDRDCNEILHNGDIYSSSLIRIYTAGREVGEMNIIKKTTEKAYFTW